MNIREAAEYAGVSFNLIMDAIRKKELKAYKYEMAHIGAQAKGEPGYIYDVGAIDIDKWLKKHLKDHQRPQRLVAWVSQPVYDKFVTYCAKRSQKCSWVINDLIVKELLTHGYKLQGYSKKDKK